MKTLTTEEYRKLLAGKFEAEARRDKCIEALELVLKDVEWSENSPTKRYLKKLITKNQ